MGLFSRQFGVNERVEMILPDGTLPNHNSLDLTQKIVQLVKPFQILGIYELSPVLAKHPGKRIVFWAFFYGYVARMGMGLRLSVSEIENAAYFVFQSVFTMSSDDAIYAIAHVQDMSETNEISKCIKAGMGALDKFMNGQSNIPVTYDDIEVLL